jgi:hypothetical protein
MNTLTTKFDAVHEEAKPVADPKKSLAVSYIGKNTSPTNKSPDECVASAFGEADKKFTLGVKAPIRWKLLYKLLHELNTSSDKVAQDEIVIVMAATGAASWNEAVTIDHPEFVTMAYLNSAEVSKSHEKHEERVEQLNGAGSANDFGGFVYVILMSKRILELLVKMKGWPNSRNRDVNKEGKMPKYATWSENATRLISDMDVCR